MEKPSIENLKAKMAGKELNIYQKTDALVEFNKLIEYLEYLEKLKLNDIVGLHPQKVDVILKHQMEDTRQFVDRYARDKGAVREDFDGWIKDAPIINWRKRYNF